MLKKIQSTPGVVLENRFMRFLLAGGFAAACNFGSRFLYEPFVGFSAAVVLAFATGLTVGYVLNKYFVFTTSGNSFTGEVVWFVLINLLALTQTWGLSVYLAQSLPGTVFGEDSSGVAWARSVAHGAGILLPVFTSYVGHRYITFRE